VRLLVEVTEKHIRRGRSLCGLPGARITSCPVALAIRDRLSVPPDIKAYPQVKCDRVIFGVFDQPCLPLPRSAQRFISKFDSTTKGKPFRFYLQGQL